MTSKVAAPVAVLAGRLSEIQIENGYHSDAGLNVTRGSVYVRADEAPALSIVESQDEPSAVQLDGSLIRETVSYQIQGIYTSPDDHTMDVGHQILADIKRAVLRERDSDFESLGGTAVQVQYTGHQVIGAEVGSRYGEILVFFDITTSERYGDPDQ